MNQKRNIIIIIVAAAMLVGLVILALTLDAGRNNPGTTSTGGQSTTESTGIGKDKWAVTYEEYNAMSGAEQEAFYYSFDSADDYFKWYNAAKKTYEDNRNDIVIDGDSSIDLGDILNKK